MVGGPGQRVPELVGRRVLIQRPIRGPIRGAIQPPTGDPAYPAEPPGSAQACMSAAPHSASGEAHPKRIQATAMLVCPGPRRASPPQCGVGARVHSARQGPHNGPSAAQPAAHRFWALRPSPRSTGAQRALTSRRSPAAPGRHVGTRPELGPATAPVPRRTAWAHQGKTQAEQEHRMGIRRHWTSVPNR